MNRLAFRTSSKILHSSVLSTCVPYFNSMSKRHRSLDSREDDVSVKASRFKSLESSFDVIVEEMKSYDEKREIVS